MACAPCWRYCDFQKVMLNAIIIFRLWLCNSDIGGTWEVFHPCLSSSERFALKMFKGIACLASGCPCFFVWLLILSFLGLCCNPSFLLFGCACLVCLSPSFRPFVLSSLLGSWHELFYIFVFCHDFEFCPRPPHVTTLNLRKASPSSFSSFGKAIDGNQSMPVRVFVCVWRACARSASMHVWSYIYIYINNVYSCSWDYLCIWLCHVAPEDESWWLFMLLRLWSLWYHVMLSMTSSRFRATSCLKHPTIPTQF